MTRAQELAKQLPTYQHPGLGRALVDEACQELLRMDAIEAAARNLIAALDKLDEGCREPGFRGFENGNGDPCGDEAQSTREVLEALLVNVGGKRQCPAKTLLTKRDKAACRALSA